MTTHAEPQSIVDDKIHSRSRNRAPRVVLTICVLLLLWGHFPHRLQAQQLPSVSSVYPELEEYLRIARESNPELRSLWHNVRSQMEGALESGILPDPEINVGYTLNPMRPDPYSGRFSVSVMQMFPWFGTLQTRRSMENASTEALYQQLNQQQLRLMQELQSTWLDLAELRKRIDITRRTAQLIRDLETLVEVRYETARAGQADLLRIQMEEHRLQTMIDNLKDRVRPVQAAFNAYLNRDPDQEVVLPGELVPIRFQRSEEDLRAAIRDSNPLFEELDARKEVYTRQKELARLQGYPSFGLGVSVTGRNASAMSMFPDSRDMVAAMATIRIPLYRSRYTSRYRRSEELLSSIRQRRFDTENRLFVELEEMLTTYRESTRTLTLLNEELIPRAEQAYQILSEEYASGNVWFDELLRLQEQLLELELERVEVLTRQHKAILQMEAITGGMDPYPMSRSPQESSISSDSQGVSTVRPGNE